MLINIFNVTEITMDNSGIGIAVSDALKEKGVKVNTKRI